MFSPLTRLIIAVSILFLAPLGLLSWINYDASRTAARAELVDSALPLTRDNIYSEIHSELIEPINVSSTMANDAFLKEWVIAGEQDPNQVIRFLQSIQRKYGYFSVFFISAKSNQYYHYERGLHKVISEDDDHDQWYFDFVAQNVEYELDVDNDEAGNNKLTIFINFRVMTAEGEFLGVTGVGMKMDKVAELLSETGDRYNRRVYLVDHDGIVQAHINREKIMSTNIKESKGITDFSGQILKLKDQPANYEYKNDDSTVLLTVRYIPELDWFLLVEQDEHTALVSARYNFFRTIGVGVGLWFIAVALTVVLARRHHNHLESIARTDPLTGLPNRRLFIEQFQSAASRQERTGTKNTLLLLDLDGFKQVNDTLGHIVGDKTLLTVVKAMKDSLRPMDVLARWGGDEFIVLAEADAADTDVIANRIRESVKEAMKAQAGDERNSPLLKLTVSCGLVRCSYQDDLDELVHQADILLYKCKEQGGDQVIGN